MQIETAVELKNDKQETEAAATLTSLSNVFTNGDHHRSSSQRAIDLIQDRLNDIHKSIAEEIKNATYNNFIGLITPLRDNFTQLLSNNMRQTVHDNYAEMLLYTAKEEISLQTAPHIDIIIQKVKTFVDYSSPSISRARSESIRGLTYMISVAKAIKELNNLGLIQLESHQVRDAQIISDNLQSVQSYIENKQTKRIRDYDRTKDLKSLEAIIKLAEKSHYDFHVPISFEELPDKHKQSLLSATERRFKQAEELYRQSPEARCIRLVKEIQSEEFPTPFENPTARKISGQLASLGIEQCECILKEIAEPLSITDEEYTIFATLISNAIQAAIKPAEVVESAPDTAEATTASSETAVEPEEKLDPEFITDYFNTLGLSNKEVLDALCATMTLSDLERSERVLATIPKEIVCILITSNPLLVHPDNITHLDAFARKLKNVMAEVKDLANYLVFNPAEFPEHFHSIEQLDKTSHAASLLKKIRGEVIADFRRHALEQEKATEHVAAPTVAGHPEQHLIDRLAPFVTYPNIAYAILREAFFYQGEYKSGGVPEQFRRRLISSAFSKTPNVYDLEKTEKELITLGMLEKRHESSRIGANLVGLVRPSEITNATLKDLMLALTNKNTRPSKAPKLTPN